MMDLLYVLIGQTPVMEPNPAKWAYWYETADRRVAFDAVGPYRISTMFLGIDHDFTQKGPPLLFETMVFPAGRDAPDAPDLMKRYATWSDAEKGHRETVAEASKLVGNDE